MSSQAENTSGSSFQHLYALMAHVHSIIQAPTTNLSAYANTFLDKSNIFVDHWLNIPSEAESPESTIGQRTCRISKRVVGNITGRLYDFSSALYLKWGQYRKQFALLDLVGQQYEWAFTKCGEMSSSASALRTKLEDGVKNSPLLKTIHLKSTENMGEIRNCASNVLGKAQVRLAEVSKVVSSPIRYDDVFNKVGNRLNDLVSSPFRTSSMEVDVTPNDHSSAEDEPVKKSDTEVDSTEI